jgi:hypothetical protein
MRYIKKVEEGSALPLFTLLPPPPPVMMLPSAVAVPAVAAASAAAAAANAKRGRGLGGQKLKTEPRWLSFGSAVLNKNGGCWWMLMGLLVRGNGGRGAARSQTQAGERGWGPKTRNRAQRLGFRLY